MSGDLPRVWNSGNEEANKMTVYRWAGHIHVTEKRWTGKGAVTRKTRRGQEGTTGRDEGLGFLSRENQNAGDTNRPARRVRWSIEASVLYSPSRNLYKS